jgi:hypothetical protein
MTPDRLAARAAALDLEAVRARAADRYTTGKSPIAPRDVLALVHRLEGAEKRLGELTALEGVVRTVVVKGATEERLGALANALAEADGQMRLV